MKQIVVFVMIMSWVFPSIVLAQRDMIPRLLTPIDNDTLKIAPPIFSWTIAGLSSSSFALRIVQVLPFQTPEAAILSNPTFYFIDGIKDGVLVYPVGASALLPGRYAWQVMALKKEGKVSVESEVFDFIVVNSAFEIAKEQNSHQSFFIELKYNLSHDAFVVKDGKLPIKLLGQYNDSGLIFQIKSESNKKVLSSDLGALTISYGDNRYSIDLQSLLPGHYFLETVDPKGQKMFIRFKVN